MTAEEWKERAKKRFIEKAGLDEKFAKESAQACFDNQDASFLGDDDYNPEACVDEELSYWGD